MESTAHSCRVLYKSKNAFTFYRSKRTHDETIDSMWKIWLESLKYSTLFILFFFFSILSVFIHIKTLQDDLNAVSLVFKELWVWKTILMHFRKIFMVFVFFVGNFRLQLWSELAALLGIGLTFKRAKAQRRQTPKSKTCKYFKHTVVVINFVWYARYVSTHKHWTRSLSLSLSLAKLLLAHCCAYMFTRAGYYDCVTQFGTRDWNAVNS